MHLRLGNWDFIIYKITIRLYIKKVFERLGKEPVERFWKKIDYKKELCSLLNIRLIDTSLLCEKEVNYLSRMYFEHRFDLLGSGWKCVNKNAERSNLNTDIYQEIDWKRDYISGYIWSTPIRGDKIPQGADIKTVWELSRMQYLLQLSIFAIKFEVFREQAIREYKNVIEDFITHNIWGQGVNWTSAMDVAIRSINMLMAYDIFQQLDKFDILGEAFKSKFVNSIYEHEQFILRNLECDLLHGRNNNHYLSDLLGLLVIEAYLNIDRNVWLFAYKEILREMKKQYNEDGSNFEGSTSYHRLSTEILVLSVAFIARKEGEIPKNMLYTLNKASYFTQSVTKLNGRIVQIGDNDSGRIIKLSPQGVFLSGKYITEKYINLNEFSDNEYFDEEILNHGTLLAEIGGLIDNDVVRKETKKYPLESSFIKAIAKVELEPCMDIDIARKVDCRNHKELSEFEHQVLTEISIENEDGKLDNSSWEGYPDFGLYYYKTDIFHIFLKIKGKNKIVTGHIHDDILHVELNVRGKDIFVDPGTYTYTADKEQRDSFRSCAAHIIPFHGESRCIFEKIFQVIELVECEVLQIDKNEIAVLMIKGQLQHYRSIKIEKHKIIITDKSNQPFVPNFKNHPFFSSGYGKIEKFNESGLIKIISKKNSERGTL